MYRRVVLTLYAGGRGRTAGALTASRYTDHILKCFSLGSVHSSEKKQPETHVSSDPAAEGKKPPEVHISSDPPAEGKKPPEKHVSSDTAAEGKMDMPHKEESSQQPKGDTLINVIKGMKVEVSAKNRLQPKKHWKKEHLMVNENMEGLESSSKLFQMASKANQPKEEKEVSPEMKAAVSAVASTFPNKKNQVESELLRQLRLHKQMAETQRKEGMNISDVLSGMQIKSSKDIQKESVQQHARVKQPKKNSLRLFAGKRLRMFPAPPVSEQTTITESSPTLWDIELAKAIAAACEQPPRNGFEEMIQWTNEGKLWTFPINNEAGFVEEQNVEFHEHIFLDKYLEDFPKQGPIRHFIELVVCGLSKNPYLTVQQKKEHIDWFRDYFNQKEDILRECEVYLN